MCSAEAHEVFGAREFFPLLEPSDRALVEFRALLEGGSIEPGLGFATGPESR